MHESGTFVTFTAEKSGGIVRIPSEIDADSIVSVGQFVARYGAREMAKWEDTWGFLADGGGTYESVKGVVQIARDNSKTVVLASTKTHPSDATLADFRTLRTKLLSSAMTSTPENPPPPENNISRQSPRLARCIRR